MKRTVHNFIEAKTLVKESIDRGDIDSVDEVSWFTHEGVYLFTTQKPYIDAIDEVLLLDLSVAEIAYRNSKE